MFGGMLTVIGTSTNILASELSGRLIGWTFTMFEFTSLGVIVSVVGAVYLLTVGRWLVPARIKPQNDLTEEFEMAEYLTEVVVREDSPVIGQTVAEALQDTDFDVDLMQLILPAIITWRFSTPRGVEIFHEVIAGSIIRGERVFLEPLGPKTIRAGDVFAVRTDRDTLVELSDAEGFDLLAEVTVDESVLEEPSERQNLVEVIVAPGASLVGETLASSNFRQRFDATVLALRRGGEVFRKRMDRVTLRVGDTVPIFSSFQ
jgi:di/tricarboxylate transporter